MSKKILEWAGIAASIALIVTGLGAIGTGIAGVNEVRDKLAQENIVGTDDSSIPGQKVNTGSEAKAFADVMRKHALESTEGLTYAEMGRFVSAANPDDPAGTSDEAAALKDESGEPLSNGARNVWVTETALATALNVSFFAERVAFFSIAMGIMLLLTGIGFLVLMLSGVLRPSAAAATAAQKPISATG
jgi:hypothetical protein